MSNNYLSDDKIIEMKKKLWDKVYENWLFEDFNKWTWWLNVVITIVPFLIWWKFVDRKRQLEIAVFGLHMNIFSSLLDEIGTSMILWDYPNKLIPSHPAFLPFDYTIIPISYMFIYQYFKTTKSFIIASIILSAIFSFIAEPILTSIELYNPIRWKYIYSFPIYFLLAILSKKFTKLYFLRDEKYK